jgi:hypothetical protein
MKSRRTIPDRRRATQRKPVRPHGRQRDCESARRRSDPLSEAGRHRPNPNSKRACGTLNDAQFAPNEDREPRLLRPRRRLSPSEGHSAARYTHTLLDAMERARAVGRLPADDTADTASPKRRAEIHSPLHSPGTQAPGVMRHCGRFGAVSKIAGAPGSLEGSNPSPSVCPGNDGRSTCRGAADASLGLAEHLAVVHTRQVAVVRSRSTRALASGGAGTPPAPRPRPRSPC